MKPFIHCCLLAWLPAVSASVWEMEPDSSRLEFTAKYEGQAVPGLFRRFDTHLDLDPAHPQSGQLRVKVDLASVDMHSSDLNEAVVGAEWLDPTLAGPAEFTSRRLQADGPGRFLAEGLLRLKGREQPLRVPFRWSGDHRRATLDGALTLRRTDFGVGTGDWAAPEPVAREVEVQFHLRLHAVP